MKIAIQGAEGSFHHIAAEHYFEKAAEVEHDYVYCDTFAAVFATLAAHVADAAVIAIENSLYGSIADVYDGLQKYKFCITGEIVERIHQNLIGFPGTDMKDIERIYSHPVAIAQCAHYLASKFPGVQVIEHQDTAAAVADIRRRGDHAEAAIAGSFAADLHEMEILQAEIQDEQLNYTRFIVIDQRKDKAEEPAADADKASLIITTSHEPGSLHRALGVFAEVGSNLTKLQSRPIPGKVWKYQFYLDVGISPDTLTSAIAKLKEQECVVTNLGTYTAATTLYED
ncbi:MAG TPA: prephenate dehydratase domain-containing protein [Candidatus Saccharimonadales bacterium]